MPEVFYFFGSGCFRECPLIETLSMTDTSISFGSETFKNCNKLKSVHIGCNVTVIQNCQILSDVSISSFITLIEFIAFDNALLLPSTELPEILMNLGRAVFKGCISFTTNIIPSKMKEIKSAFISILFQFANN